MAATLAIYIKGLGHTGGKVEGVHCVLNAVPGWTYFCDGFSIGATIARVTGARVVV
jgi:hypothetical protein